MFKYPYVRKMNGEQMSHGCRFFFIDQAFYSKDNDGMNKISENLVFIKQEVKR